jgi:type I restriction enzyme S subunit
MKRMLVPKMRFPEFRDAGEWEEKPLGNFIEELRAKSSIQDEFEVLTSSRNGLIRQRDYYDNNERMADRDNVGFNIIPPNYLTYRSRSDDRRFFFNENNLGVTGIISSYYPVFRLIDSSNKFLVELLSFHSNSIGKRSVGTSQTVLSLNELRRIQLPLPKIEEQKRIADCLSSIDALISAQSQNVEALRAHKNSLMQELFPREGETIPRLRFPEFRDAGEWGDFPLSNFIMTLDAGVSVNSGDRPAVSGEAGILKTSAVTNGIFEPFENKVVLDESELRRLKEPVCEGTIIISRMNTPALVGANAYVEKSLSNIFLPDRLWAAKARPKTSMRFVACILGSEKGRSALCELASGSSGTMKNITKPDVLALRILAPDFPEQQKIADCLSSIDELIRAQRQKLDTLKTHKKSLMQQLFAVVDEVAA